MKIEISWPKMILFLLVAAIFALCAPGVYLLIMGPNEPTWYVAAYQIFSSILWAILIIFGSVRLCYWLQEEARMDPRPMISIRRKKKGGPTVF